MAMPHVEDERKGNGSRKEHLIFSGLKGVVFPEVILAVGEQMSLEDVKAKIEKLVKAGYSFRVTRGRAVGKNGSQGIGLNIHAELVSGAEGLDRERVYSIEIDGDSGVSVAEYEDLGNFVEVFSDSLGEKGVRNIMETGYKKIKHGLDQKRSRAAVGGDKKEDKLGQLARRGSTALTRLTDISPTNNRGPLGAVSNSFRQAWESLATDKGQMMLTADHVDLYMAAMRRHFPGELDGMGAEEGMQALADFSKRALNISVERERLEAEAQKYRTNHDLQVQFVQTFKKLSSRRGEAPDPLTLMRLFIVYGSVVGLPDDRMEHVMEAYTRLHDDGVAQLEAERSYNKDMAVAKWTGIGNMAKGIGDGAGQLVAKVLGEVKLDKDGKVIEANGVIGATNTVMTVTVPGALQGLFGAAIGELGDAAKGKAPKGVVGLVVMMPQAVGEGLGSGLRLMVTSTGISKVTEEQWQAVLKYGGSLISAGSLVSGITAFALGAPIVIPVVLAGAVGVGVTATVAGALSERSRSVYSASEAKSKPTPPPTATKPGSLPTPPKPVMEVGK